MWRGKGRRDAHGRDAQIGRLYDDGQIGRLYDDGQIGRLYDDDGQIGRLYDDGQIGRLYDDGQIGRLYDDDNTTGIATTTNNKRETKMAELYKNKYRVESARLKNWDYSSPGGYFITICTKNRDPYFGKIVNGEMVWSEMGQIVDKYWREIPIHFPHAQLDEFVVMPNHFHGIIKLVETPKLGVSTTNANWKPGSLGVIINQYKRICTIQIKKQGYDFAWQSRFYDHIIRNNDDLNRIRQYIINNPLKWQNDDLYPT